MDASSSSPGPGEDLLEDLAELIARYRRWVEDGCHRDAERVAGEMLAEASAEMVGRLRRIAADIRAWHADRQRIGHQEEQQGGVVSGSWEVSDDAAVEIVRAVQDWVGPSAVAVPQRPGPGATRAALDQSWYRVAVGGRSTIEPADGQRADGGSR